MKALFFKRFPPSLFAVFLILTFFLPSVIVGKVPIPADSLLGLYHPWRDSSFQGFSPGKFPVLNPLITDPILQTYPWRKQVIENFKDRELPLWNPYSFSGQPLLANSQSSPFQVLNILFFILPFNIAWGVSVIATLLLTSFFMFSFLKSLGLSKAGASFGAFVLPSGGFFISWFEWGTIISTAMWLPLILLSINKITKNKSVWWSTILVFAASQTIFSGHLQTALYVLFAAILYLALNTIKTKKLKPTALIISALAAGIFVSMIQIIPTAEFINLSARSTDQAFTEGRQDWFIPKQNLIQFVAPDFFGNPTTYNYWGVWNYGEFVGFVGIVPLTLAIFALLKKDIKITYFAALAIVSIILAIENPISKLPYLVQNPLSSLQPSRIIFLLSFSLASLSAIGVSSLQKGTGYKKLLIAALIPLSVLTLAFIFTLANKSLFPSLDAVDTIRVAQRNLVIPALTSLALLAAIIIVLTLKLPKKILIVVASSITVVELFRFGYKFTPFTNESIVFPQTEALEFLSSQEKPFRVMATDRRILHPNTSGVYSIESIEGYDPLYTQDYAKFITVMNSNDPQKEAASFGRIITPQNPNSKLVDLLNTKFVLTFDQIDDQKFTKVFEEGRIKIYENTKAVPRAYFVENIKKANSIEQEYSILLDEEFDIFTEATSRDFSFSTSNLESNAEIISYNDQQIMIKTESNQSSPLILTTINYPGWRVEIDGQPQTLHTANALFQAVVVPDGQHTVSFRFQPNSFYNGLYLSISGVILTLIILLWGKRFRL